MTPGGLGEKANRKETEGGQEVIHGLVVGDGRLYPERVEVEQQVISGEFQAKRARKLCSRALLFIVYSCPGRAPTALSAEPSPKHKKHTTTHSPLMKPLSFRPTTPLMA